jgi:hypothetical protein
VRVFGGLMATALLFSAPLVTTAEAQSKDPIKIGFNMALTGALAGGGQQSLLGMQIWAPEPRTQSPLSWLRLTFPLRDGTPVSR